MFTDCSCSNFTVDPGYGNCLTNRLPARLLHGGNEKNNGAHYCFVNEPSNCKQLIDYKALKKNISTEPCGIGNCKQYIFNILKIFKCNITLTIHIFTFCIFAFKLHALSDPCGQEQPLTLTSPKGSFSSPYFPLQYQNKMTCSWQIKNVDQNTVYFQFDGKVRLGE